MAQLPVSYTNAKTSMQAVGLPVSAGANWLPIDQASWNKFVNEQTLAVQGYSAGPMRNLYKANYGFLYTTEMPQAVTNLVGAETYTATNTPSATTGVHPLAITFTIAETNDNGSSFFWNFGDGTTAITTVPTATHTYNAAGTFNATVVPTVHGLVKSPVAATPITLT